MKRLLPTLAPAALALLAGCTVPPANATITIDAPSDSTTEWNPVADYLGHRCGSLDCHGAQQRSFIIWSCDGLRLAPNDVPGCRGPNTTPTTPAEYYATYRSLVGLEPAVMSYVVSTDGADPDLLTFVRKARGEEAHKGGQLIDAGDVQDQCVCSWLAGNTNTADCTQAIDTTQ